jgi:beta-N-acetylhexosaminidase
LRPFVVAVLALVAVAVVAATSTSGGQSAPSAARSTPATPATLGRPAHSKAIQPKPTLLQSLSDDQLAGQHIIYAYAGLNPPASLLRRIRAGEGAGVILFGPNISTLSQVGAAVAEMQRAAAASPIREPLLIMTDQEGGQVRRLPGPPELSEKQIGQSPEALNLAFQAGQQTGENLDRAGINVNLAPVLDVYRQAGNFIDEFERSYSTNPRTVAVLGGAFITAQQATGVAATAKHFPGLGAAKASQDTDDGPVTLDLSLNELRNVDELPYRTAITDGVKLVMTSWATYSALDASLPAGLSTKVITGELRQRLGFHGVTITDGLAAGALSSFGSIGRRAFLAAKAGADLLLCSATHVEENTPHEGIEALQALASAMTTHKLTRESAEESAQQILTLRARR